MEQIECQFDKRLKCELINCISKRHAITTITCALPRLSFFQIYETIGADLSLFEKNSELTNICFI